MLVTRKLLYPLNEDQLRAVAPISYSYAGIISNLGFPYSGSLQTRLKDAISRFDIDVSHFTGQVHHRSAPKHSASTILVAGKRNKGYRLKRALLEVGVPYKCASCGLGSSWNGKKIVLEVDHKNGVKDDNRQSNLRFLCPNCHSQTDTFRWRNTAEARRRASDSSACGGTDTQGA